MNRHAMSRVLLCLLACAPLGAGTAASPAPTDAAQKGATAKGTVSQQLAYSSPYAMDAEKTVSLTDLPSMRTLLPYLLERMNGNQKNPSIKTITRTDERLRIEISRIQSVVLTEFKYWEYLFVTAYLVPTKTTELDSNCPENIRAMREIMGQLSAPAGPDPSDRFAPPLTFMDQARQAREALQNEQCTPRAVYELSLVVDGQFAAGGLPAAITGYTDMTSAGYFKELEAFTADLASGYETYIGYTTIATFDQRTGMRTSRGSR